MKYNIEIMGRYEIIRLSQLNKLPKDCIVISINDTGYTTDLINKNIRDILVLEFDDIDSDYDRLKAMTYDDGIKIREFINKYKDSVVNIIIHCTAGVSRSAGVACGIALYLNGTDEYIWRSKRYLPKRKCYEITASSFGITISDEDYKYKASLNERDNKRITEFLKRGYISLEELMEE